MILDLEHIEKMDKRQRTCLVNCLSGYKSPMLIGTQSKSGQDNLALFSSIFHLGANPPLIGMISRPHTVVRDTLENIIETGEYTINLVDESFYKSAHQCSARYPQDESEFLGAGIEAEYKPGFLAPFVLQSSLKIAMEMKEIQHLEINKTELIIGQVKFVEIDDEIFGDDGFVDIAKAGAMASLGLDSYHPVDLGERQAYAKYK
ncbi:flavin reductase [Lentisphaera marina]|uniref:flavin reductase family protein n=1 Tax=Lentisphaera marina TaxID=1111041 RepID=UPI0023662282|nr:flavin reductase [Lentisphaera marina]MDD7984572.1 flavin reductase [Lentisphaera marina]